MSINETLPALDLTQSGGQILNYQNTFDRVCDEIRMKIQTENFFGILHLISTRLPIAGVLETEHRKYTTGRGPIIANLHVTRERTQIFWPFFADDNNQW